MSKPSPIWQHLPVTFKESMVRMLDFKSRRSLRMCSREERRFVDSLSSSIDYLCLKLSEPAFNGAEDPEKPAEIQMIDKNVAFSKRLSKSDSIDTFVSIFRENRTRLTVKTLEIHVSGMHQYTHFFQYFKQLLRDASDLKMKAAHLKLTTVFRDKTQFVSFVGLLDPTTLVSMTLERATTCQLDALMHTEQWKGADEIEFETRHELKLEWVLHANRWRIRVKRLQESAILAVVRKFLSSPRGSHFSISSFLPIRSSHEPARSRILGHFEPSLDNQNIDLRRFGVPLFRDPVHVQKIQMTARNSFLLLIFNDSNVSGVVCNADDFERGLQDFMSKF